jgi:hypothetical protein
MAKQQSLVGEDVLAAVRAMLAETPSSDAKTRKEWEEAWGTCTRLTMTYIHAGIKAGLMRYNRKPFVMINGHTKMIDAYEIVQKAKASKRKVAANRPVRG